MNYIPTFLTSGLNQVESRFFFFNQMHVFISWTSFNIVEPHHFSPGFPSFLGLRKSSKSPNQGHIEMRQHARPNGHPRHAQRVAPRLRHTPAALLKELLDLRCSWGGTMIPSEKTMGISPISCRKIGYLRVPNDTKHVKPNFLMAKVSGMLCRFRTGVWLSKLEMLQYHMGWKQKRNLQRARFSLWWLVLQFWLT